MSGFPILAWAGLSLAHDTYAFWRYGVEKNARVVALDHTSRTKGGTTFYYLIEVDGRRFVKDFRVRLPEGNDISVLALPEDPEQVTIGNRNTNAFEIFAYSIGGDVMAVLVLVMFCLMIWFGPRTFVALLKARRQMIDG
jgi:hypothetical protein